MKKTLTKLICSFIIIVFIIEPFMQLVIGLEKTVSASDASSRIVIRYSNSTGSFYNPAKETASLLRTEYSYTISYSGKMYIHNIWKSNINGVKNGFLTFVTTPYGKVNINASNVQKFKATSNNRTKKYSVTLDYYGSITTKYLTEKPTESSCTGNYVFAGCDGGYTKSLSPTITVAGRKEYYVVSPRYTGSGNKTPDDQEIENELEEAIKNSIDSENPGETPQGKKYYGPSREYGTSRSIPSVPDKTVNLSSESKKAYIINLYKTVLGRNPSNEDINSHINNTPQQIAKDIILSTESNNRNSINSKSNQDFVKILYTYILGRDGEDSGISSNVIFLNNGGSRQDMIKSFVQSDEFLIYISKLSAVYVAATANIKNDDTIKATNTAKKEYIRQLYVNVLGRNPSNEEIKAHLGNSVEQTTYNIVFSDESKSRNNIYNISNKAFVENAYKWVLGRNGDSSGITNHTNLLDKGKSRKDLLKDFLSSTEFKNRISTLEWKIDISNDSYKLFIRDLYKNVLGREPSNDDISAHMKNSIQKTAVNIILSDEAKKVKKIDNMSNEDFVKLLYKCILGRDGEAKGISDNAGFLKNSGSKQELIRLFVESDEFYNTRNRETKSITLNENLCSSIYYYLINNKYEVVKPNNTTLLMYERDYNKIVSLDLNGKSITDLTGISNFTNLEKLVLSNNTKLNNINDLNNLKKLKILNMNNDQLGGNVSKIFDITSLEELYLDGNKLTSNMLNNINKLTNLNTLSLSNNNLNTLSQLSNLNNLKILLVNKNSIKDISGISNLKLNKFSIESNNISISSPDMEISLPSVIKDVKTNGSLVYSSDNYELVNCSVNDGKLVVDEEGKIAKVTVKGGNADKTVFTYTNTATSIIVNDEVLANRLQSKLGNIAQRKDLNGKYKFILPKERLYAIQNLDLSSSDSDNSKITDISGLEGFVNLKAVDLSNNNISNLDKLSSLKNISTLTIRNNGLVNLNGIKNITSLAQLDVSNNKITDISGVSNLSKLENLIIDDNDVKDLSPLNKLSNTMDTLSISDNNISDVNGISSLKLSSFYGSYNNLKSMDNINKEFLNTIEVKNNNITLITENNSVDIPNIIQDVIKSSSINNLELVGCSIKNNKIVLNTGSARGRVTVRSGYASDTVVEIKKADVKAPNVNVEYKLDSSTGFMNVTVTSDEEIQKLYRQGWSLSENNKVLTKTYEYNTKETIVVKDLNGNETVKEINVTGVTNKDIPGLSIEYSNYDKTQDNVTLKIKSNVPLYDYGEWYGWEISSDKKELTRTFTENYSGTISMMTQEAFDNSTQENPAKSVIVQFTVENIDREAPTVMASYSTAQTTKGAVTATIWSNEEIEVIDDLDKVVSKITDVDENNHVRYGILLHYNENVSKQIRVKDLAGNESLVNININNIDNSVSGFKVTTSNSNVTNTGVKVTAKANEDIKLISGNTTISEGIKNRIVANKTINDDEALFLVASTNFVTLVAANDLTDDEIKDLTFDVNDTDYGLVEGEDKAGNSDLGLYDATNIDKTAPVLERKDDIVNPDGSIVVTLVANEEIQGEFDGWVLAEDGKTLTKTFKANKNETIKFYDLAGNVGEYDLEVTEVQGIKYNVLLDKIDDTDKVLVTIEADRELVEIDGWILLEDKTKICKIITAGETEEVVIEDINGNTANVYVDSSSFVTKNSDITDNNENQNENNNSGDDTTSPIPHPQTGKFAVFALVASLALCVLTLVVLKNYRKNLM